MLLDRLCRLYGEEVGATTEAALRRLIEGYPQRTGMGAPLSGAEGFDEHDALLITYGDSLLARDRPPLAALGHFASSRLRDLVSGIHILPFFPSSSDYGFAVIDHLRVDPELGGWDDIARLGTGFKLMFDFVLNHASARSEWFRAFLRGEPPYDRFFITANPGSDLSAVTRPRATPLLTPVGTAAGERWVWTTFSADQVDLNYASPEVLMRMVEVMLAYVEHGAELLRMDAVGYLWKEIGTSCIHLAQTHEVVKLLREVLDEVAPRVAIITETNVPHRENVSYFGDGHDEAQMVYQFALAPLVLDAFARADAGQLSDWASMLTTPTARTTFFNFLASHDGIGVVPARGILSDTQVDSLVRRILAHGGEVSMKVNPDGSQSSYELNATFFDALSDPADLSEPAGIKCDRFLSAQAIMLALAGVPGIYIHSLFGSHNDDDGFRRSGWKRDLNHERLHLDEIEARLDRADAESTQVFTRYAHLLRVRRAQPAFHPNAPQRVVAAGRGVFGVLRGPRQDQSILALHSVSDAGQTVTAELLEETLGGSRCVELVSGRPLGAGEGLRLAPYRVAWIRLQPA